MLNRYGKRTLPCRVPRVTQNGLLYELFHVTIVFSLFDQLYNRNHSCTGKISTMYIFKSTHLDGGVAHAF